MWQMQGLEEFGKNGWCNMWQSVFSCQATCRRQQDHSLWAETKWGKNSISILKSWTRYHRSGFIFVYPYNYMILPFLGDRDVSESHLRLLCCTFAVFHQTQTFRAVCMSMPLCFFCYSGSRWSIWLAQSFFLHKKYVQGWFFQWFQTKDHFLLLVCILKCVARDLHLPAEPHNVNGLSSEILSLDF